MNMILVNKLTIPKRLSDAHKGDHGSVAIVGGADGMLGAVTLASRAALLAGAGRVYACFLSSEAPKLDVVHPEIMIHSPGYLQSLEQLDCVVIGPGLGTSDEAKSLLSFWLQRQTQLLLDADALNLIASNNFLADLLMQRNDFSVITPHVGEAARLLKTSNAQVQENRIESCLKLAQQLHTVCVLKGAGTVVAQEGQYLINATGNPGLASGGTGDVLSGIIGSLISQGLNSFEAAKTGVFVHGAAADALVSRGVGPIGLCASEIANEVRCTLNFLNTGT
jgi:ADP-dependent NAD(P)H-hydrate dehydratase / NAD(P)H-hydrate epimerase